MAQHRTTPIDFDSTLVRSASVAATFSDMESFAESIEVRPLDKLLADLPGLASLSDTKFTLARRVIRRRAGHLSLIDLAQLRIFAEEVAASAPAGVAERIRTLL